MTATTGGAEPSECYAALDRVRRNDGESWVRAWARAAEEAQRLAEATPDENTAYRALLRSANYTRAAMFSLLAGELAESAGAHRAQRRRLDERRARALDRLRCLRA